MKRRDAEAVEGALAPETDYMGLFREREGEAGGWSFGRKKVVDM